MTEEDKIRRLKIGFLAALARGDKKRAAQLENKIEDNTTYWVALTEDGVIPSVPGAGIGIKGSLLKHLDEEK
jgi:hypothetical protein